MRTACWLSRKGFVLNSIRGESMCVLTMRSPLSIGSVPTTNEHDRAIAIDGVPARAWLQTSGRRGVPLAEAVALGKLRRAADEEHLGLRLAKEGFHVLAELLHLLLIGRCQLGPGIGEAHVLPSCRDREREA